MVHNAILVNLETNLMVYETSTVFEPSMPELFTYEASNAVLNVTSKEDSKGATLFLDDAPTIEGAKAIIKGGIAKVVYKIPVENSNETAACQILEQHGIPAIYNPNIYFPEHSERLRS